MSSPPNSPRESLFSKLFSFSSKKKEKTPSKDPTKEFWMQDKNCKNCYECHVAFSAFVRRHHCRSCGRIFCSKCTANFIIQDASGKRARTCDFCFRLHQRAQQEAQRTSVDPTLIANTSPQPAITQTTAASPAHKELNPEKQSTIIEKGIVEEGEDRNEEEAGRLQSRTTFGTVACIESEAEIAIAAIAAVTASETEAEIQQESFPQMAQRRKEFEAINQHHIYSLVQHIVDTQSLPSYWVEIIVAFSRMAAKNTKLSPATGDCMDIRKYVKVKCIAGGSHEDSTYIGGVMIRKNVAHKAMKKHLRNPRILLLSCALEYEREENRFASITTIMEQEREYLHLVIAKLASVRPDVIVVEKSVSRIAQEMLLEAGITLVLNVKPTQMERIARLTGAEVLPSTDHFDTVTPSMGSCATFRVETFKTTPSAPGKTCMFFEGCPQPRGCTLVIRGETQPILRQVKTALLFTVFVEDQLRHEIEYLMDIDARTALGPPGCLEPESYANINNNPMELQHVIFAISAQYVYALPNEIEWTSDLWQDGCPISSAILGSTQQEHLLAHWNVPGNPVFLNKSIHTLAILVSYRSRSSVEICVSPESKCIVVCGESDMSLGKYLLQYCFVPTIQCFSSKCKRSIYDHERTFTHSNGRIKSQVHRRETPSGYLRDQVVLRTRCCKCPSETAPRYTTAVSSGTWNMSFALFLEMMLFNCSLHSTSCGHHSFRDHMFTFFFRDMAASFYMENTELRSIVAPPTVIPNSASISSRSVNFQLAEILDVIRKLFRSVQMRQLETASELMIREQQSELQFLVEFTQMQEAMFLRKVDQARELPNLSDIFDIKRALAAFSCAFQHIFDTSAAAESSYKNFTMIRQAYSQLLSDNDYLAATSGTNITDASASPFNTSTASRSIPQPTTAVSLFRTPSVNLHATLPASQDRKFERPEKIQRSSSNNEEEMVSLGASPSSRGHSWPHTPLLQLDECVAVEDYGDEESENDEEDSIDSNEHNHQHWMTRRNSMPSTEGHSNLFSMIYRRDSLSEVTFEGDQLWVSLQDHVETQHHPWDDDDDDDDKETIPNNNISNTTNNPNNNNGNNDNNTPSASKTFPELGISPTPISITYTPPPARRISTTPSPMKTTPSSSSTRSSITSMRKSRVKPISRIHGVFFPNTFLDPSPGRCCHFSCCDLIKRGRPMVYVCESEPSSIIAFALATKMYADSTADRNRNGGHVLNDIKETGSNNVTPTATEDDHLKIQWESTSISGHNVAFHVKVYFAAQFEQLRVCYCEKLSHVFIESLARCREWVPTGGKSGSGFVKTLDDRFILKQLSPIELQAFLTFGGVYFDYMTKAYSKNSQTCLCKVLGVYRVAYRSVATQNNIKVFRQTLVVMENLFYDKTISQIFDLKGSRRNRLVRNPKNKDTVLLDDNFIEYIGSNPLFVKEETSQFLSMCIWNDTMFLSKVNVVDYSLLVGMDESTGELVVGIIDYLRQYTWDKQLETIIKSSRLIGSDKAAPTVISPEDYKHRFRDAMEQYFVTVPEKFSLKQNPIAARVRKEESSR